MIQANITHQHPESRNFFKKSEKNEQPRTVLESEDELTLDCFKDFRESLNSLKQSNVTLLQEDKGVDHVKSAPSPHTASSMKISNFDRT